MSFICNYLSQCFHRASKLTCDCRRNNITYHYVCICFVPMKVPDYYYLELDLRADKKIFATCYKNDVDLFEEIYKKYNKVFYISLNTSFTEDFITQYVAPNIICNYFDKPNESYKYYLWNLYEKDVKLQKYYSKITDLKMKMYTYNMFVKYSFKKAYIEYQKKMYMLLVKRTMCALTLLEKKNVLGHDILNIIKEYIL